MRTLLVVLSLLAVATAQVTMLTKANKYAISQTNAHRVERMDIRTHKWLKDYLGDLEAHATWIQVNEPLANGHTVTYKFLEGNKALVTSLGAKHRVQVTADRLTVNFPDVVAASAVDAHSPAAKATKPYGLAGNPINKNVVAQRKRDFRLFGKDRAARTKWYNDNNMAQASKMHVEARPVVEWLLKQVQGTKTIVELQAPVPGGHLVRFAVIEGSVADLQRFGSPCKIKITSDTIEVPDIKGGCHTTADADVGSSPTAQHEVDTNEIDPVSGVTKPIPNIVKRRKRNVVKVLPENWIKA